MADQTSRSDTQESEPEPLAESLNDMLQEVRVLFQGVQLLTAFLIVLPFYQGFAQLTSAQRAVYLATFTCALTSLIIFSAPAAQHRIEWPLRDRPGFKRYATRMIIIGLAPFSLALILVTHLVVSIVAGEPSATIAALLAAALIALLWWILPLRTRLSPHPQP